jgi:AraC-like DNA-binding protein
MNSPEDILFETLDRLTSAIEPQILYVRRLPNAVRQGGAVQAWPRINIVLEGVYETELALADGVRSVKAEPGCAMVVPAFGYAAPTLRFSNNCLSLVLRENYLRLVYHEFDAALKNDWPPMVEYHLEDTLSISTIHAFNSLIHLGGAPVEPAIWAEHYRLLLKLIRADLAASSGARNDKAYRTYQRVVRYIEDRYDRTLTRAAVGRALHLSTSYFTKLFQRYAACSMHEFQMELRMKRAEQLLSESALSISEIAYACGFQNTSFFIRHFKRRYSVTPGRYRAQQSPGGAFKNE